MDEPAAEVMVQPWSCSMASTLAEKLSVLGEKKVGIEPHTFQKCYF